jgi:hypothetical protein
LRLGDIAGMVLGSPDKGHHYAEQVFAERALPGV